MAIQNVCFFNKHGFCKYSEKCRKYHEKQICENTSCEIKECLLRHPKKCKYFRDLGYCKFGDWCKFLHKSNEKSIEVKQFEDKLDSMEKDLKKKSDKVLELENNIKDMHLKFEEHEKMMRKLNKKLNVLKEKETLLLDLEIKVDILEKKLSKTSLDDNEKVDNATETSEATGLSASDDIKCKMCEFTAINKFGLKIHIHKEHSTAKFKCFTCDFTCENHDDLVEHSDKYYYSHRVTLRKEYEKLILDEFQQLDEEGFLIHRTLDW